MAVPVAARPARREGTGLFSRQARSQYAALAWLQYRTFVNSLRTRRGGIELGARILSFLTFSLLALGPAVGMGFGAWYLASSQGMRGVAMLLWVLCLVWQCFSALAPMLAGQNPELSHLLRYPVSFGSWVLLYLVHGLAAPSTLIGLLWAAAIGIGFSLARPQHILWTALTLLVFSGFNLLLSRMVLSWVERWMAQRRTREIVMGVLLFAVLVAQFFNPVLHQSGSGVPFGVKRTTAARWMSRGWAFQKALPPGLAWQSMTQAASGRTLQAAESCGWLGVYLLAVGGGLGIRLRAESRGENLSEVRPAPGVIPAAQLRRRPLLDFSGPLAAVFEKDLRYLLRSGPMLYSLATPLLMVFLFGGAVRSGQFSAVRIEFALPLAMVWAFLGLTRILSNNLGTEGEGIRFYFLSPTPLRTVILGKNLLHLGIFIIEAVLIVALVLLRFGPPEPAVAAATIAWLLFALPANLAAGNLLSVTMPYRMNLVRMRREPGALGNGLLSMLAQMVVLSAGAAVLAPCAAFDHLWLATPILLLFALAGAGVYLAVLHRMESMIDTRKESLLEAIAKNAPAG